MGVALGVKIYKSRENHLGYWCPGCEQIHILPLVKRTPEDSSWVFDGNLEKPSFDPSINIKIGHYTPRGMKPPHCDECNDAAREKRNSLCLSCHSFVKNGMIKFLADCSHKLAGQTVELPNLPDHYLENKEY